MTHEEHVAELIRQIGLLLDELNRLRNEIAHIRDAQPVMRLMEAKK